MESEYFKMHLNLQTNRIIPVSNTVTTFGVHNFQNGRVKLTLESVYNKIKNKSQFLVKSTKFVVHIVQVTQHFVTTLQEQL